ncbi:MAG: hypothetical protein KME18_25735 [Phormidium tanganyikae FI6-MK23]|jgi:hypothetical protein|nr:hypothetical protein [Phormidium tanganyikae FI6-MK23]
MTEFFEIIWGDHPQLRGYKTETVLFALSACAHRSTVATVPRSELPQLEATLDSEAEQSDPFNNYDDLDS